MPWKEMRPASPEEKEEALERLRKAEAAQTRYEKKIVEVRRERREAIKAAYPILRTKVMREALNGLSYGRLHDIVHDHKGFDSEEDDEA